MKTINPKELRVEHVGQEVRVTTESGAIITGRLGQFNHDISWIEHQQLHHAETVTTPGPVRTIFKVGDVTYEVTDDVTRLATIIEFLKEDA